MIYNKQTGMQQIKELLHFYISLRLNSESADQVVLSGNILVNRISKGYTLYEEYQIEIIIPIYSNELPYVIDVGHNIDESYPHRYADGKLCLETDTSIRIRFIEGFSLLAWISEYVEPYFFSYEYYKRYGDYPFGERGHGIDGLLQTYEELFKERDMRKVFRLMASISSRRYRGHMPCPCGSNKKFRVCHGVAILKYYMDDRLNRIASNDYQMIREALEEYHEQQRNSEKTK